MTKKERGGKERDKDNDKLLLAHFCSLQIEHLNRNFSVQNLLLYEEVEPISKTGFGWPRAGEGGLSLSSYKTVLKAQRTTTYFI